MNISGKLLRLRPNHPKSIVSTMAIDLVRITDLVLQRLDRDRGAVTFLLDAVASEASALAEIWERAVAELEQSGDATNDPLIRRWIAIARDRNAGPFGALMNFYRIISTVLHTNRDAPTRETVVSAIARLLTQRDITVDAYRKTLSGSLLHVYADADTTETDFHALASSVAALKREAAALRVLAVSYRAQR